MQFATRSICNTCNLQHVQFVTHAICNTCQKINTAEREAAKKETEKIELGYKIKEMKKNMGMR